VGDVDHSTFVVGKVTGPSFHVVFAVLLTLGLCKNPVLFLACEQKKGRPSCDGSDRVTWPELKDGLGESGFFLGLLPKWAD